MNYHIGVYGKGNFQKNEDEVDIQVFYSCLNPEGSIQPEENFLKNIQDNIK